MPITGVSGSAIMVRSDRFTGSKTSWVPVVSDRGSELVTRFQLTPLIGDVRII